MKTSSQNSTEIHKGLLQIVQPGPAEQSLPITWTGVFKLMILLAGLWAIIFGIAFVILEVARTIAR